MELEIKFNVQQEEAVKNITEQLIKGDVLAWTLMGYAGTGKTTLASYLADVAKEEKMPVIFVAPTNKAVEVLRKKGNRCCCTIHHLLYRVVGGKFVKAWQVADAFAAMERRVYKEKKVNGLIICDEASMLSDKLLDDLEEYAEHKNCKILYMGDPFQLPPVEKYSRTVFDNPHKSVLTQVMRQGEGSSILTWATALRQKQVIFSPKATNKDVAVEDSRSLWYDYLAKLKAGKDITMVTWKNDARIRFNMGVRKTLGYEGKTLQVGEPIMGISNGNYLRNGETMNVPENIKFLGKDKIFQDRPGYEKAFVIDAEFYEYEKDGEVHRLILVPSYNGASIAPQTLKGLYYWYQGTDYKRAFVDTMVSHFGRRKSYKTILNPSVTICTYGYAITAHKSQGSQWDEVYITGISKLYGEKLTNARWLYTAVTRAENMVHMLDGECPRTLAWEDMDIAG